MEWDIDLTDAGTKQAAHQAWGSARQRWLMLLSVMAGLVAALMSSTIFNVAIPDLSRYFGVGQDRAQWVSSAFMAANTAAMLTTPWMLARFGYRHVCYGCMLVLLAGALLGGLASSFPAVLLARVVQGIAAGIMMPIGSIIILRAFQTHEQGRVSAIYMAGVVLVPAVAPAIGGALVEAAGWRSIFFMGIPFCLAALWLARRHLPDLAPGGAPAGPDAAASLDWIGLFLASLGTVFVLNGVVALQGQRGSLAAAMIAGALAALAGFIAWQLRLKRRLVDKATRPLVDLGLFRYRQFAMGCLVGSTYGAALYGSTYLLPVYLQVALGLSPAVAGSILMPSSLILAASVTVAGRFADRQPPYRMVSTGLMVLASSFALMVLLDRGTPLYWIVAFSVVGRIGLGFVLPSLNLGAMRALPAESFSYASSSLGFVQMVGGSVGVSVCGAVLQWRLSAHGVLLGDPSHSVRRLAAFNDVFLMLAALCAVAMMAAWGLRPLPEPPGARR